MYWSDIYWWIYHSFLDPGNILATIVLYTAITVLLNKLLWQKHIKPHLERTKEIHAHLGLGSSTASGAVLAIGRKEGASLNESPQLRTSIPIKRIEP